MALQVALAGRFSQNEAAQHPTTVDAFLRDAADVIAAGASGIHVDYGFLVDEQGRRLDQVLAPVEAFGAVINPLRERFGRSWVSNVNVLSGKTFDECMSPARAGLCEVAPCASGHPIDFVVPAIDALQQAGVKPEIVIHSPGEIELAKRRLIDSGLLKKPYYFIVLYGMPFNSGRTLLSGTWAPNTQDIAQQLFLMVNQLKGLDEDAQITVCAAGRATFYMTTLATMLGLHIRVGTEDTIWRNPLSDELSAATSRCSLGRERSPSCSVERWPRPMSIARPSGSERAVSRRDCSRLAGSLGGEISATRPVAQARLHVEGFGV